MTSNRTVSRLSRILALIPYVLERDAVDVDDVLARFGYTAAELSRDLETVFVCGLPGYGPGDLMEAYIDEDEVIIDAADYFTRAPRLTPTEALSLLAAGLTLIGIGEGTPALESAVRKLTKVVMPEAGSALAVDVLDETDLVRALKEATLQHRVVHITYRSVGKEETTERDIEPWSVFNTLGRWYVTGHCRLVGDERTFRVDRIRNAETLEEAFDPPSPIPDPVVGYTPSEGDVSCLIALTPRARWVLEYYPVDVVEARKDETIVRFTSPEPEVPARLLVRLGDTARLVEGDEVRKRLDQLGKRLLSTYR